jgi:LPXTG-motif cell wall-anchored protein
MYNDSEYGYQTYKKEYSDNLVREAFVSNSALTTGADLSFIVILESGEVYQGNYTDKTGWVYDRILNDYSILSIESINFTSEGLNLEATSLDGTKIKIANGILENSNSKDGIENPQTGVFLPISLILLGTTLSGGIYFYTKKKNIFHKI